MLKDVPIVPYIPASDLDRARRFYEGKVGLTPRDANAGGVAYPCAGGSWIYLYKSVGAGTSKASQAFWQVGDIDAEVRELKARGVDFIDYDLPGVKTVDGIATMDDGTKGAWFNDSEGNILALIQAP